MDIKNINNLLQMCRSCLNNTGTISLYAKEESFLYSQMLSACTSIKVAQADPGPHQLCNVCTHRLKDAFLFRNQCQQSEARLKELPLIQSDIKLENFEIPIEDEYETKTLDCDFDDNLPVYHTDDDDDDDKTLSTLQTVKIEDILSNITEQDGSYSLELDDIKFKTKYYNDTKILKKVKKRKIKREKKRKTIKELYFKEVEIDTKVKQKKRIHPKQLKYYCDVCPYAAPESYLLNRHMRIHTGEKPYKCDICDARFPTAQSKRLHVESHNGVVCDVCGKLCKNKGTLSRHKALHIDTKDFQCHLCMALYSTRMQLNIHIRTSHIKKRHYEKLPCTVCHKLYVSRFLNRHMESHSEDISARTCTICHTILKGGKYSMRAHMLRHTEGRKFICDCCSKSFNEKGHLRIHMLTHFGIRKYKCEECDKSFVYKNALVTHKITHTKTKDQVCDVCNQRFAHVGSLFAHRKKKHNIQSQFRVASRTGPPITNHLLLPKET